MWLAALNSAVVVAVVAVVGSLRLPVVGRLGRLLRLSVCCPVCLCVSLFLSLSHVAAAHVRSLRNPTYLPGVFKRSPRQRRRAQAMCAKSEKSTKSRTVKGSNNKLAAATANRQHRWQQQVWLCQAAQPTNSPPSATVAASSSNSSVFPCCSPSLPLLICSALLYSSRRVPHGVCAM